MKLNKDNWSKCLKLSKQSYYYHYCWSTVHLAICEYDRASRSNYSEVQTLALKITHLSVCLSVYLCACRSVRAFIANSILIFLYQFKQASKEASKSNVVFVVCPFFICDLHPAESRWSFKIAKSEKKEKEEGGKRRRRERNVQLPSTGVGLIPASTARSHHLLYL